MQTIDQQAAQAATTTQSEHKANTKTVALDDPIIRGEQEIGVLRVNRPTAGALRGVSLIAVANLDVSALQTLLPRICDPILTPKEIANIGPADLMALGAAVATFFISRTQRAELEIE